MQRHLAAALSVLFLASAVLAAPAFAGGSDIEASADDTKEHGAPFFGEALNVKGMKPLEGVRVKAQLKGRPLPVIANTDADGRFSIRGFGRNADPANVTVACEMDGFKLLDLTRRRVSKAADAATVIECLFEKQ
ncbi:MAG: carboxypeptidase-like regulatory domain-containing protein [Beijerinckiaceae bacterium]